MAMTEMTNGHGGESVTGEPRSVQGARHRWASAVGRMARPLAKHGFLLAVLLGVGFVGTQLSPFFLTVGNLRIVLVGASVVAVLAVGQFFVIVTSGIDLSPGSTAALASVILGISLRSGIPWPWAVVLALLAGALIGLTNGFLVVYGRITAFIATLAMLSVVSGLAFWFEGEGLVSVLNKGFISVFAGHVGSVPTPIIIFVSVLLVASFTMSFSTFGRTLYAIGGNDEAARLSGLPVDRARITVYIIGGVLAGLAGLMMAAQLTEGSARIGTGYELQAIAAVVVGGASLFGGKGNPFDSVLGGMVIATIINIMNLRGLGTEQQLIITGLVILVAVFVTSGRGADMVASALGRRRQYAKAFYQAVRLSRLPREGGS